MKGVEFTVRVWNPLHHRFDLDCDCRRWRHRQFTRPRLTINSRGHNGFNWDPKYLRFYGSLSVCGVLVAVRWWK